MITNSKIPINRRRKRHSLFSRRLNRFRRLIRHSQTAFSRNIINISPSRALLPLTAHIMFRRFIIRLFLRNRRKRQNRLIKGFCFPRSVFCLHNRRHQFCAYQGLSSRIYNFVFCTFCRCNRLFKEKIHCLFGYLRRAFAGRCGIACIFRQHSGQRRYAYVDCVFVHRLLHRNKRMF